MEKYFNVNESGCSISCKIYCNDIKTVGRVVIYGHGFSGHKDNKAAQRFADYVMKKYKDIAVITFNAPCHGDDVKKNLILDDCNKYIGIVVNYAKTKFGTDKLYGYATSFGGYQFLKYMAENGNPFCKAAFRCPAVNMYEVLLNTIMEPADIKALSNNKPVSVGFDRKIKINKKLLDDLKAADITGYDYAAYADSILILHGTKDEVVSYDVVKNFADKNGIGFISVEDADHRFIDPKKMDTAIKKIVKFFEF